MRVIRLQWAGLGGTMKLRLLILLLFALPLRADTIFTNIGPPGAVSYDTYHYGFVQQGIGPADIVTLTFTPTRSARGSLGLFFPVFWGDSAANSNGIYLSLADASGQFLFQGNNDSGPFFSAPPLSLLRCCSLFEVRTPPINLLAGEPYTLTMFPETNAVEYWFLAGNGDPGLLVTTPEASTLLLLGAGLVGLLLAKAAERRAAAWAARNGVTWLEPYTRLVNKAH
jgi:hypothetical protein